MFLPARNKLFERDVRVLKTAVPLAIIGAVFGFSRWLYASGGVVFDTQTLIYAEQFLDPELLRSRLWESLLYLHCQPPLFNFYLGLVLKFFPGRETIAFAWSYRLLGLGMGWALFSLLRRFRVSGVLSAVLVCWFLVSPACVLYENYLFDTYPMAALLVLSALFLHRFLSAGRKSDAFAFFWLLGAVVLTRNVFHLVWLLLVLGVLFIRLRRWRGRILASAFIPTAMVAGLYLKNLLLFGSPTASSSLGTTLYHVGAGLMPQAVREKLVGESRGRISELSLLPPIPTMKPLKSYPAAWSKWPLTGIPALDEKLKANGQNTNFNHIAYLHINKRYAKDSLRLILARPEYYLRSVRWAIRAYFLPASDYFFDDGKYPLPFMTRLYDVLFYGRFPPARPVLRQEEYGWRYQDSRMSWFLVAACPLLFAFGVWEAIRAFRKFPPARGGPADRGTLLFILYSMAWWTSVTCLVSMGENMRHRFVLEPYYIVLLGLFLTRARAKIFPAKRKPFRLAETGRSSRAAEPW